MQGQGETGRTSQTGNAACSTVNSRRTSGTRSHMPGSLSSGSDAPLGEQPTAAIRTRQVEEGGGRGRKAAGRQKVRRWGTRSGMGGGRGGTNRDEAEVFLRGNSSTGENKIKSSGFWYFPRPGSVPASFTPPISPAPRRRQQTMAPGPRSGIATRSSLGSGYSMPNCEQQRPTSAQGRRRKKKKGWNRMKTGLWCLLERFLGRGVP